MTWVTVTTGSKDWIKSNDSFFCVQTDHHISIWEHWRKSFDLVFRTFFMAFIFIISSFQVKHIEHSSRKPCTISGLSFIPFQANLHIKWALKPPKHHWIWNHEMKKEGKSNKFDRKQNVWRCDCRSQRLQTSFGHQIAGINSRCHHPPQYLDSDVALINI